MSDDLLRRVPPQNLEAEESVLGAVLIDNAAINEALEVIRPRISIGSRMPRFSARWWIWPTSISRLTRSP
jgi:hypothetical protein